MQKTQTLLGEYRFPGFRPKATLKGIFGDPKARVITLIRRQKKQLVAIVAQCIEAFMTRRFVVSAISLVERGVSIWMLKYDGYAVRGVIR